MDFVPADCITQLLQVMEILAVIKLKEEEVPAFRLLSADPLLFSRLLKQVEAEQSKKAKPPKTICITTKKEGPTYIVEDCITHLTGDCNTVCFHYYATSAADKLLKLVSGKNLKTYEEWAKQAGFFRCSQRCIVNLRRVVLDALHQCFILTVNEQTTQLPISRKYWKRYKYYLLNLSALKKIHLPD